MVKCREKIDLNDRKKSEKFFACVEPYLHPQEGKFVKEQIALALFQMEKITNPTECVGDLKKNLESVYQKGLSFVCFKSVVDGKEKESFAVFQKNEKTKSWRNAKIIRLKYH